METRSVVSGTRRLRAGQLRARGRALLLSALLLALALAPEGALAAGANDGYYYFYDGSHWNYVLVQTLSSGLVFATQMVYVNSTAPLVTYFYDGFVSGSTFISTEAFGYAGTPPRFTLDFSGGTVTLTTPGSPPTSTTFTSYKSCGAGTSLWDGPYWGSVGLVLHQTIQCGSTPYPFVLQVAGLTTALTAKWFYRTGALTSGLFSAQYFLGVASPYPSLTINFQNRTYSLTPSGGSTLNLPLFSPN